MSTDLPLRAIRELEIETTRGAWPDPRAELRMSARGWGVDLRKIELHGLSAGAPIPNEYWEQLESAAGYWIRPPHLLADSRTRDIVLNKIQSGHAWAVVVVDRNYLDDQNRFLQEFGITGTFIGVFRRDERAEHIRCLFLERQRHPAAFRDSALFHGVKSIGISGVHGIICKGEAQAVLAVPGCGFDVVDTQRDFFTDWPAPDLPCIGVWRHVSGKGGVIAISCDFYSNPFDTNTGHRLPGIEWDDNRRLCSNLIRVIADVPASQRFGWEDANRLIHSTEANLFFLTRHVLENAHGQDWWTRCVPDAVQQKCVDRWMKEGRIFPQHAYMELIDYKKIWRANWGYFLPVLAACGVEVVSKDSALKFFESIHPIRLKAAHPTKVASIGQHEPSNVERIALEAASRLVTQMHARQIALRSTESPA